MQNSWIMFKLHLSTGVLAVKCLRLPVHMNVCLDNCVCSHFGVPTFVCGCEGFHLIGDGEGVVPFIRMKKKIALPNSQLWEENPRVQGERG